MPLHILWIYSITLLLLTAIGLVVFTKNPREAANRAFFFFTVSTIVWIIALYSSYSLLENLDLALSLFRLTYGASVLVLFSLTLFFYYFPRKTVRFPWWGMALLYGTAIGLSAICIFTPLIEESIYLEGEFQVDVFGPLYSLYLYFMLFHMVFAFILVVEKFFRVKGIEKKQVLYAGTGFFLFIVSALMTNVVLPVWDIFMFQAESPIFTLFFCFLVFFAIYKQRFFKFSYVTLSILRYLIAFSIFLSITFGTYYTLLLFFPTLRMEIVHTISISVGFLVNIGIERYFPNLYSFSFSQFKKTIASFNLHIFDYKTFAELIDFVSFTFYEKLNIKDPRIFILENDDLRDGIPMCKPDKFTQYLEETGDVIVGEELIAHKGQGGEGERVLKKMQDLSAELCFPLRSQGKLIGLFLLGNKTLKSSFSREEIEEIGKAIPGLEVTLMNILITNSLREENDIMKKIIHKRTVTLRRNNEKLEKMIEQQDNFISLTAHEFRTPLTVAMLGLEQISYLHKGKVSAEVEEDVKTSHEQLYKLAELINRLMEMRRVEDNKIPLVLEELNIVELVKETARGMQLLAQNEGRNVTYKGSLRKSVIVKTDRVKLQEVLDNLLQNAIKFSKKGGKVEVNLSISEKKKTASIAIKDYGKGISKKDQKVIFDKYQQGSHYNQGIGIGLYLCKSYMDLLKGKINVKSTLGKGATFTVEIPIER